MAQASLVGAGINESLCALATVDLDSKVSNLGRDFGTLVLRTDPESEV